MVTCSELATVVATECNTFHIWGSKPIIQSPLSALLSGDKGNCYLVVVLIEWRQMHKIGSEFLKFTAYEIYIYLC